MGLVGGLVVEVEKKRLRGIEFVEKERATFEIEREKSILDYWIRSNAGIRPPRRLFLRALSPLNSEARLSLTPIQRDTKQKNPTWTLRSTPAAAADAATAAAAVTSLFPPATFCAKRALFWLLFLACCCGGDS